MLSAGIPASRATIFELFTARHGKGFRGATQTYVPVRLPHVPAPSRRVPYGCQPRPGEERGSRAQNTRSGPGQLADGLSAGPAQLTRWNRPIWVSNRSDGAVQLARPPVPSEWLLGFAQSLAHEPATIEGPISCEAMLQKAKIFAALRVENDSCLVTPCRKASNHQIL